MTVMTRSTARSTMTTTPMPSDLEAQPQQREHIVPYAINSILFVKEKLENAFPGETLGIRDVFTEICSSARHAHSLQYAHDSEHRQYVAVEQREELRHRREQQRHDENMDVAKEERGWMDTLEKQRDKMYESLLNEALKALYVFFALHLVWHFVRLRHIWSFSMLFPALQLSICGLCTLETTGIEQEMPAGTIYSFLVYVSSFLPSLTTVSSWVGVYLTCTTICAVKFALSVLFFMLAAMIIPVWMVKYISAGAIVFTMLANVLELVPFVVSWGYMGALYFLVWAFWTVYIWSVCHQSQDTLKNSSSRGTTPSHEKVTEEMGRLKNLTNLFWLTHQFVLGGIVGCCYLFGALEIERNG